ncbi:hypothetical protein [Gordonia crocea]|uniref:Uncharacterized protein n=1 Tax=Gordonia crocea TaxID=589162 RepID=A0A7I9V2A3_9ACTN|nr:hypothetical protein [Gordonia crocea]GED98671.1 hypothetical protein nbrc107697_27100 [Gordonia crocea]GED99283.1 hypothetical protein nbrc107697_33220 [Gordonia crocea]
MIRLALLVTVACGVLSLLAFKNGGVFPGIVFAVCALAPIAGWIAFALRGRNASQPLNGAAKGILSAVSVVLVAALAYSVYWTFWSTKPAKELKYTGDLSKVCDKTYFPQAAEHTGSGPHPIIIFTRSGTGSSLQQVSAPYTAPEAWRTRDEHQVQLVACLDDVSSGEKVDECEFDKGNVPVYQGRYKGRVVEARTGKKVADVQVDGNRTKDCPMITMIQGDVKDNRLHTKPDFDELQRVLGAYVNG